jgi:hypothetical protein
MEGTPPVSMRAILLMVIMMKSGESDKQKQKQFEKESPLFPRNHQNGLPQINFFVDLAIHLSAKTSTQLWITFTFKNWTYMSYLP